MPDPNQRLAALLDRTDFKIEKLAGDASDRSFFRVIFDAAGIDGRKTAVLMLLGEPHDGGELPYLNVQRHMDSAGLPVPGIIIADIENGLILMEDYGDLTLEEAIEGAEREKVLDLYKKAADLILDMQFGSGKNICEDCIVYKYAFDVEKFMFEFDFFYKHAVLAFKKAAPGTTDENIIKRGFLYISETLAAEPRFVTHRDYHSRNLMVRADGALGMVDFQDARMGPAQYDLASLLMDSYVSLPVGVAKDVYEYYFGNYSRRAPSPDTRTRFDRIYDFMTVQRNIKAAGSFAYLDVVKKKNRYLQYFQPCLAKVKPALERLGDELTAFHDTLSKYVGELR